MKSIHLLLLCFLACACQPLSNDDEEYKPGASNDDKRELNILSIGNGTQDSPYSVWQVIKGVSVTANVWVAGYIVGYVKNGTYNQSVFDNTGAGTSNIIIAANPTETDKENIITVQLGNNEVKKSLSLSYNPNGYRRAISIHTNAIATYCHRIGLREADSFSWINNADDLDLNYGKPTTSDENTGNTPDDNKPQDSDVQDDGIWRSVYSCPNTLYDTANVKLFNTRTCGTEPEEPCTTGYLISADLCGVYGDAPRFLIGYVEYDEAANIIKLVDYDNSSQATYKMTIEQKDQSIIDWLKSSYKLYGSDCLLRVWAKVKTVRNQGFLIHSIEGLDWLSNKQQHENSVEGD